MSFDSDYVATAAQKLQRHFDSKLLPKGETMPIPTLVSDTAALDQARTQLEAIEDAYFRVGAPAP